MVSKVNNADTISQAAFKTSTHPSHGNPVFSSTLLNPTHKTNQPHPQNQPTPPTKPTSLTHKTNQPHPLTNQLYSFNPPAPPNNLRSSSPSFSTQSRSNLVVLQAFDQMSSHQYSTVLVSYLTLMGRYRDVTPSGSE